MLAWVTSRSTTTSAGHRPATDGSTSNGAARTELNAGMNRRQRWYNPAVKRGLGRHDFMDLEE